jgi:lysophospholipase L1-like esterase
MGGVDAAVSAWSAEPAQTGGVMFIGDSFTYGWPADLLPVNARNRGIPGDGTQGVLYRLWLHINEAPDTIVLMIGINNFLYGQTGSAHQDMEEILIRLGEDLPDTEVYLVSILPTDRDDRSNDVIQGMNHSYAGVCSEQENCTFLDFYSYFGVPGGTLYTYDGLHLRRDGYVLL